MNGAAAGIDPYYKWLGIPPQQQPPNHYRLLAINLFEGDPDVIEAAADRQMAHVRTYQTGPHGDVSQKILNELSAARLCLLDKEKKAVYDGELRARLFREQEERKRQQTPAGPPSFVPVIRGAWRYGVVRLRRFWVRQSQAIGAFWQLGHEVYRTGRYRASFDDLYRKIDERPPSIASRPADDPSTAWKDRLKANFGTLLAERKRTALIAVLGRRAYEIDGPAAGPTLLTDAIQRHQKQLDELGDELVQLARVSPGQVISPRQLAWISLGCLALAAIFFALLRLVL